MLNMRRNSRIARLPSRFQQLTRIFDRLWVIRDTGTKANSMRQNACKVAVGHLNLTLYPFLTEIQFSFSSPVCLACKSRTSLGKLSIAVWEDMSDLGR